MQGWSSIETAPVDTVVLVHDEGYVGKALLQEDGLWLDLEYGGYETFFAPPPQHWMPLPEPPTEGE